MKLRGLLTAALVLAALTGLLYWSNHRKPIDDTAKASPNEPPKILSLNEPDITALSIRRKGQPSVELAKTNGVWRITAPDALAADPSSVSSVLTTVSSLDSDRLIDARATDVAQYGLADPALEVDVTAKGKTQKLLIGEPTITGSGSFASLAGDPRVFTIASYKKSSLDKTAGDLRDKRLLTADFDKVTQIELTTHKDKKNEDLTFARDKDSWQIVKPKPYRVETFQIDQLIDTLRDARLDVSPSDDGKKIAAAYNSASPFAAVKVTGASGTQELQVRKNKEDYYAKSSVVAGIYKVATGGAAGLGKSLDDFRNKKLFDFGFSDPDKIELHDGAKAIFLTHSGPDWWDAGGKKLDLGTVEPLLGKLRDLAATKFPDSGFGTPVIEITVVSHSGKRTENVAIAKSGDGYIAKRQSEPALYELTAPSIGDLRDAIAAVRPAPLLPPTAPKKK